LAVAGFAGVAKGFQMIQFVEELLRMRQGNDSDKEVKGAFNPAGGTKTTASR
jgi:hypothetical protein